MTELIANWACANELGGSRTQSLEPGTYRVEADAVKVVTGPQDHEFYIERPALSVALVECTPGSEPHRTWPTGRADEWVMVQDTPPTETLTPRDPAGFVVPGDGGLLYKFTYGKGQFALLKVG